MKVRILYTLAVAALIGSAVGFTTMKPSISFAQSETIEQPAGIEAPPAQAQVDEPAPPAAEEPEVSDSSFFVQALKSIGDVLLLAKQEGASKISIALAAILALAQLMIQLTKTALFGKLFPKLTGAGKLVIVYVCSAVAAFIPLVLAGTPWYLALAAGPVIGAIMNAIHQVYKQGAEAKLA